MKLHALRSAHRVERGVDLEDVRHLIRAQNIDIPVQTFGKFLIAMPQNKSEPTSSASQPTQQQTDELRINELPTFPAFDSIAATAGLTNLEAFQLRVRHALDFLPLLPANARAKWDPADEGERFTLA